MRETFFSWKQQEILSKSLQAPDKGKIRHDNNLCLRDNLKPVILARVPTCTIS